MVMTTVAVERCLVKCLLSRWVSHRDNQAGTLLQALAIQIYCTILGYKPVNVVTGCNNAGTLCQDVRDF